MDHMEGGKIMTLEETREKVFGEFYIKCKKCGSDNVILDVSSLGFSSSGIDLECQNCGNFHEIYRPL